MHIQRSEVTEEDHHRKHDIDDLDKFKRSDAMLYIAKRKAEEGYAHGTVRDWVHHTYGPHQRQGTRQALQVTKQDVANLAQKWRRLHKDVELKMVIEDPTPEDQDRSSALDLLELTSAEGLRKALAEVCRRIPSAAGIALPFLENAQQSNDDETPSRPIIEGWDMPIPEPGFSHKVLERDPHRQAPPRPPKPSVIKEWEPKAPAQKQPRHAAPITYVAPSIESASHNARAARPLARPAGAGKRSRPSTKANAAQIESVGRPIQQPCSMLPAGTIVSGGGKNGAGKEMTLQQQLKALLRPGKTGAGVAVGRRTSDA